MTKRKPEINLVKYPQKGQYILTFSSIKELLDNYKSEFNQEELKRLEKKIYEQAIELDIDTGQKIAVTII